MSRAIDPIGISVCEQLCRTLLPTSKCKIHAIEILHITSRFWCVHRIITGVAITKINRIIQFKIIERQLLANGQVAVPESPGIVYNEWKTATPFHINGADVEEGVDYHQLTWKKRSVDLDTLIDLERVVTGIRFRVVDTHIRIEIRVTDFDYQTGQLKDLRHSKWIGNDSRPKRQLVPVRPDLPTKTTQKSMPFLGDNVYVNFQPSDMEKDAAQSTIPFIDTTPLEAKTPLAGIGLQYKTALGSGGFIAPKLIVFDSGLYITPINNDHY